MTATGSQFHGLPVSSEWEESLHPRTKGGRFRVKPEKLDGNDILPVSKPSFARHGMFDDPFRLSPQKLDEQALKSACAAAGVAFNPKGRVESGRWKNPSSPRLEYSVLDPATGMFVSSRSGERNLALCRPEEAMTFSHEDDAKAVAKAAGPSSVVLNARDYKAYVARNEANPANFPPRLGKGDLDGFRVALNGSTRPLVGKVGDSLFVAKLGSHTSPDHVVNEHIANDLHLKAGLNAPRSRIYGVDAEDTRDEAQKFMDEVNGVKGPFQETVMLAEYIPNAVSLEAAWTDASPAMRRKIRDGVLKAYPFESFLAGIDVFQNDNALVDGDGEIWFVDNGAAFDFRARGGRKGWFNSRTDPDDPKTGLMSLYNHPSQTTLRTILGPNLSRSDVLEAARAYDFEALASSLPEEYRTPGLVAYAKALNAASGRNNIKNQEVSQKG